MKKLFTHYTSIVVIFIFTTYNLHSQSLYFGTGTGYGFGACKLTASDEYSTQTSSSYKDEYFSHPISFGKGMNINLFVGYKLKNHLGFELGTSYLLGSTQTIEYIYKDEEYNEIETDQINIKGKMIRLIPTLRFNFGEKKLAGYVKTGLITGIGSKVTIDYTSTYTEPGYSEKTQEIIEYSGGLSLGFHTGLGIQYNLKMMSFFCEAFGNFQSWAPKRSIITTYTVDGIDYLTTMTTQEKETEYFDSYTTNSSISSNPNEPSKSTKEFWPMSSMGINLGIMFTLGKKEKNVTHVE